MTLRGAAATAGAGTPAAPSAAVPFKPISDVHFVIQTEMGVYRMHNKQ